MGTNKVDVAKASAQARIASMNESRVKLQERLSGGKKTDAVRGKAEDAKHGLAAFFSSKIASPVASGAETARDKTAAGIDAGVDAGVPKAQAGVESMSGANDKMHDMVESLLGTISAKLDQLPAKKDELLAAAPVLKDAPAAKKSGGGKGKVLITLGLLALAGAGAAYLMSQQRRNDDPWAVADEDLAAADGVYAEDQTVTTRVVPAEMQSDATIDEDFLVSGDAARPNDTLNPNPQGYANGIDNQPQVDDRRF